MLLRHQLASVIPLCSAPMCIQPAQIWTILFRDKRNVCKNGKRISVFAGQILHRVSQRGDVTISVDATAANENK